MSEEHWWRAVPNTITHTANVLMCNKILPATLHHNGLIAHRIATYLIWPFVWWRATTNPIIAVPQSRALQCGWPFNTEPPTVSAARRPQFIQTDTILFAVAGLVADVPAASLPHNLRLHLELLGTVPRDKCECLRAYAGTGPYDCAVDLRLLRVLRAYYGSGPYDCCVCHESVSIDDEAMLGDRIACPSCGGPRHHYGCGPHHDWRTCQR